MLFECALDIRYIGQSYEITVPFSPGYAESFVRQHLRLYGYAIPLKALELVNLRVAPGLRHPRRTDPIAAAGGDIELRPQLFG